MSVSPAPASRNLDDSYLFRVTDLPIDRCAGSFVDKTFGFTPYKCPTRDTRLIDGRPRISTSHTTYKEKLKCFTEYHSDLYKATPGPGGKYKMIRNWEDNF